MNLKKKNFSLNKYTIISSILLLSFLFLILFLNNLKLNINYNPNNVYAIQIQEDDNIEGYIPLNNIIILDQDNGGKFTYIVQPGDTLSQIAYKFGTSVSTIKSVNKLKSDTIRPGQRLIITEENGILYQMPKDTSLKEFAKKYKLNLDQLKQLNYFVGDDVILQKGDEIFLPITEKQAIKLGLIKKPIVKTYIKPKYTRKTNTRKPTTYNRSTSNYSLVSNRYGWKSIIAKWYYAPNISNGFYRGHCTWYVAIKKFPYITKNKQRKLWNGNAKNWYYNAAKAGYPVGKTPKVGSIVVLRYGGRYYRNYGHVAIVLKIDWKNRKILVEEMNAVGRFIVTRRWIPMDSKIIGYIYL